MASMRNWCSALFLVPLTLLTSHAASATPTAQSTAEPGLGGPSSLIGPVLRLPKGIRRSHNGRYTRDLCDHSQSRYCFSHVLLPDGWTPDQPVPTHGFEGHPGGGANGLAPGDILNAYNIPDSSAANGKIVAILDSPDSGALSDLAAYRRQFSLPALPRCNGMPTGSLPACFAQVNESGGASTGQDGGADADSETSLDMDMISAACPDCSILLVEIGSQGGFGDTDFVAGARTAARLGAVATSISIGGPEQGDPTGYTTPGHLVLAASGDFGYDLVDDANAGGLRTPSYPASAPDVLSVGGTILFSSSAGYGEGVWNDAPFGGGFSTGPNGQDVTTSGCSTEFALPSWQSAAVSGSGCSKRATADVSAAAAFAFNGQLADIPVYQGGQWQSVEGTSASSPMVAAILTRLGVAEAISNNLGWVYSNASAFNDLGGSAYPVDSSGSKSDAQNPASCGKLCTVGPGWDGPSGVGTPNGVQIAAVGGGTSVSSSSGGAPSSSSSAVSVGTTVASSGQPGSSSSGPLATTGGGAPVSTGGASTGGGLPGFSSSAGLPALSLAGPLGATCAGSVDCESTICAEPSKGEAAVCTQACGADAGVCPEGFDCLGGYCFAPAGGDAGAGGGNGGSSGSGGCAVSSRGDAGDWTGAALLAVGLAVAATRRRSSRR